MATSNMSYLSEVVRAKMPVLSKPEVAGVDYSYAHCSVVFTVVYSNYGAFFLSGTVRVQLSWPREGAATIKHESPKQVAGPLIMTCLASRKVNNSLFLLSKLINSVSSNVVLAITTA